MGCLGKTYREAVADIGENLHVESPSSLRQGCNCPATLLGLKKLICSWDREEDRLCNVTLVIKASLHGLLDLLTLDVENVALVQKGWVGDGSDLADTFS